MLEYLKLELAIILPELCQVQQLVHQKYGHDEDQYQSKIAKARKKLRQLIDACRSSMLEKHSNKEISIAKTFADLVATLETSGEAEAQKIYSEFCLLNKIVNRAIGSDDRKPQTPGLPGE